MKKNTNEILYLSKYPYHTVLVHNFNINKRLRSSKDLYIHNKVPSSSYIGGKALTK